jgi:hypothetical protein
MEQEFDSPRAVEQPQLVASSSEKAMAASPRRADHLMPWEEEETAADAGANNETPLQGLFFMFKTIDLPRQAQDKHRGKVDPTGDSCRGLQSLLDPADEPQRSRNPRVPTPANT